MLELMMPTLCIAQEKVLAADCMHDKRKLCALLCYTQHFVKMHLLCISLLKRWSLFVYRIWEKYQTPAFSQAHQTMQHFQLRYVRFPRIHWTPWKIEPQSTISITAAEQSPVAWTPRQRMDNGGLADIEFVSEQIGDMFARPWVKQL